MKLCTIENKIIEIHSTNPASVTPLHQQDYEYIWKQFVQEQQVPLVFYHNTINTVEEFTAFVCNIHTWGYSVQQGTKLIAFIWINNFSGTTAQIHFTFFKYFRHHAYTIAQTILHIIAMHSSLTHLIGITPTPYRSTRLFATKLGFTYVATIPNAMKRKNVVHPCHISILNLALYQDAK